MDFELFDEAAQDDYAFGAEDIDNEQLVFDGDEGQRCGICMDIVVDRGVLDCCQHWFCFTCIDNWASITNLCPLCQNEFQLITCVPVYDTVGSIQDDDGSSYLRDDDNDGDDDDAWSVEGNNNTLSFPSYYIDENAVSCLEGDSCKIRSQSANIEEDPDLDTSIACDSCDLWYHAICVGFDTEGSCESSWLCPRCLVDETSKKSEPGTISNLEHLVDANFPMNVSVSVADAGETAVVVSVINGNQQTDAKTLSSVYASVDLKIGNQEDEETKQVFLPTSDVREDDSKSEKQLTDIVKKPKIEVVELDASLPQGKTSTLVSETSELSAISRSCVEETSESSFSDGLKTTELFDKDNNNMSDNNNTSGGLEKKKVSKVCKPPADKDPSKTEKASRITGAKRKQRDYSALEDETKTKMKNSISSKVVKNEQSQVARSISEANDSGVSIARKRKAETNIRDIVQGTYRIPSKRLAPQETSSGPRIKKIMRRSTHSKDSLTEVQNLRKEIRDAIRSRSSKEVGDNLFDPKLLAAFRTALTGQISETKRPPPPLDLKAKKALLQKGSIRENLTKKIYGAGGKRKRAWTRDCEIEFWKHRCSKVSKPEKIETLKSVLDLLRKGPEVAEMKNENNVHPPNLILSRLYVADASVFPRKDDIKPLASVNGKSTGATGSLNDSNETKVAVPCKNGGPANGKVKPNKSSEPSSRSRGGPPMSIQKESGGGSSDIIVDKKKWALEVLARKTAVSGNSSSQGQDSAVLKGKYPLLAKLPVEMRPSLAQSRHNKIPISVRQAQLYRLTEHFLKKTNMPVTRPTAEIELAVADAINIEKAVADKSNSKLVYVNLCSQELLHRSDTTDSTTVPDSEPITETKPAASADMDDLPTNADVDVDEALRNAGLLSDSPPASPHQHESEDKEEEDGPDNVFEIVSQPELDIYGDFEYDLEDDDFIGKSALTTSKVQQDDIKMKMVFSTIDFNKADSNWQLEDAQTKTPAVENANEDHIKEKSSPHEGDCEELYGPDKEPLIKKYPEIKPHDLATENNNTELKGQQESNPASKACDLPLPNENGSEVKHLDRIETKEKSQIDKKQQSDKPSSVFKKVEAYIKEHIRPLCKSGVITVEQYRWAVAKTTEKIMRYHSKDTSASFLIKEGEKVKKLAEQYVESAQNLENNKQKV